MMAMGIKQKTDSNFLNDSYGIHVDKNNVFVCNTMDNNICVLGSEGIESSLFLSLT